MPTNPQEPPRVPAMFKLTLRDLLWLVLVVAMGCAWWVDRSRVVSDRARVVTELDDLSDRYKKLDKRYDEVIASQNHSSPGFLLGRGYSTSTSATFTQPNDGR